MHRGVTGYPSGKKGEDIPLIARSIGVVDAVLALIEAGEIELSRNS